MYSHDLPWLRTCGNAIVDGTGNPVRLRGVNRSGLEYAAADTNVLAQAGFSEFEMDAIADWGANVIRLPFTQSRALSTPFYNPDSYLAAIGQVISMAAQRGMYTMLDLQWLDMVTPRGHLADGSRNFVPPLPNLLTPRLWSELAARYRDEPAVLFDIFNEPHDPLPDDLHVLQHIGPDGVPIEIEGRRIDASIWQSWALHLLTAIRREHPDALVFVSGLDWGYDLESFPLPGVEGIVYSSHVYPQKKKSWDRAFGHLSRTRPVFVAEWGGRELDLAWGKRLVDYLDERSIGWAAWSWADQPHLLQPGPGYQPTRFGALVRSALRGSSA